MNSMYGVIEVRNTPKSPRRYIVARADHGALWYWGSWDDQEQAKKVAEGFDTGVVIEKRADEDTAKAYSSGYADGFSEGMHEKRWRDI